MPKKALKITYKKSKLRRGTKKKEKNKNISKKKKLFRKKLLSRKSKKMVGGQPFFNW